MAKNSHSAGLNQILDIGHFCGEVSLKSDTSRLEGSCIEKGIPTLALILTCDTANILTVEKMGYTLIYKRFHVV